MGKEELINEKTSLPFLKVIDRLEVGPVKVEAKRISAPYRVIQNNHEKSTELVYCYEEPVFDPSETSLEDLAGMIVAQVAVNYGLFCRTIVFHGAFDKVDQRFISDMMENTAREIYVKKFLEPNPFLVGIPTPLTPEKHLCYSQAYLEFPNLKSKTERPVMDRWLTRKDKIAVLSSGGKDSLLSFGLLNEIEWETHPVFINESGRHWFTALNAYRYFKKNVPHTAKVWTNADRVFTWMLRHFSFIRKDFSMIRSDEYPVRLWTVAVFLFGALPLLRKRDIGRLVIGNESDTTRRTSHKGIKHYDGLYDQSRYFDNALSQYFYRKKWFVSQFSILRYLSELLVQKILVEHYPALHEQQVSCHAAHIVKDRVYPCGACEKCRRIVGMLLAIEADPAVSGYSPRRIQQALNNLATKEIQQEAACANHLKFMLAQKGLMKIPVSKSSSIKEHPEIFKMRFDPERSPFDTFPVDLRKPLYSILLNQTNGAVYRQGKMWIDFDPIADKAISQPYSFEKAEGGMRKSFSVSKNASLTKDNPLLGELTWPEAEQRFKEVDIALLPVGSIEQHGPHLPLDTDAFDADYLVREVAAACSHPKPLVLPLIPYGVSYHHDEFKGTFSISNETLSQLVYEIGKSASGNGISKLVIINGHGGNIPALNFAAQMINRDTHIFVCVDTGETSDVDINDFIETPNDVHAGEIETSTSLALRPSLVKLNKVKKRVPEFSNRFLNFSSKRGISWYAYTKKISSNGVMGDPTKASAEKGRKIWKIMIARLTEFVEDLKNMTLDEIYQRRY